MPGAVRRAPPRRLAGLNKGGAFKPIPRAAPRKVECCESPKIEISDGSKTCLNCGTQLSESNIVAEVTFGETATGAATVQGGFVGETARHARTLGAAAARRIGAGFQSREETEQNGRTELRQLCPPLHIPSNVEEIAFNLWKLAAGQNFIQGRRTSEVAGCCLYAACRRDKHNTILLMDISEALSVNVFKLGDVYKELSKALYLEVHSLLQPIVEVEPLIMKYCNKLEFGDRTRQVAEDAARIIKRMRRDWMVSGRHPAGLCGACIILAARMNNFRRTVREVVYVVKVADMTITSRLAEFKNTHASTLTVDDFRKRGLKIKHQHDPPSFHLAQKRAEGLQKTKRKRDEREEARRTVDVSDTESVTSSRLSSPTGSPSPYPQPQPQPQQQQQQPQKDHPDSEIASTQPSAPKRRRLSGEQTLQDADQEATPRQLRRDADGFAIPDLPLDPALREPRKPQQVAAQAQTDRQGSRTSASPSPTPSNASTTTSRGPGRPSKKPKPPPVVLTDADFAEEEELEREIETVMQDRECISSRNDTEREKLEERSKELAAQQRALLAANQARSGKLYVSQVSDSEIVTEDEFANDPEVMNALLSEEQVRVKEKIWVAHNEDWLRAQQAKHLKRALDEAEGRSTDKRNIKRRKRSRMGDGTVLTDGGTPVESPADAATRMLDKRAPKGWSKSVDYAALNRILGGNKDKDDGDKRTPDDSQSGANSPTAASSIAAQSRESTPAAESASRSQLPTPPTTQVTAGGAAGPGAEPVRSASGTAEQPEQIEDNAVEVEEEEDEEEEEDDDEDDDDNVYPGASASPEGGYPSDGEDDFEKAVNPMGGFAEYEY